MNDEDEQFSQLDANLEIVGSLERIALVLERILIGTFTCGGLLGLIAFLLLLRLLIGR